MNCNIDKTERIARVFIGSLLIGWGIFFGSRMGAMMFIIGIIPLVTGFVGNCPFYTTFKNNFLEDYKKR